MARAPQVRVHRVRDPFDGSVHHVGVDLAPQVRQRAAAEHPDRIEPPPDEAFRGFMQPLVVVRDTVKHRAGHRPQSHVEGEVAVVRL